MVAVVIANNMYNKLHGANGQLSLGGEGEDTECLGY